ncbi:MAG: TetR/AcrR family transcriptional regulator [Acidobacteria bacterium]|nr:TetR/AcrR family transcriptional regulator [Acidobacteriota bacterium]
MTKQSRSVPVIQAVLDETCRRLIDEDESLIRVPDICAATGVNYGSVYHHFGSREGLIDAAYHKLFLDYAEHDIEILRNITEGSETMEEFVAGMSGLAGTFSHGAQRARRRALRIRIVAASLTRPELYEKISATQDEVTAGLMRLIEHGQSRGWLRSDITSHALAIMIQANQVGRILDDISGTPIEPSEWEPLMFALFAAMIAN